jgi:N-acetylglutamate synthase-like GNAT family acetyltransferase
MNIRKATKSDFQAISKLLLNTFNESLSTSFSKKAATNFKKENFTVESLQSRMDRYMFVVEEKNKIIGFLEAEIHRIRLFFVEKKHQGKGVGKALLKKIESLAKKNHKTTIYVNASISSVPIYKSLGFKNTTGKRKKDGKQYQPMKKILN